MAEVFTSEDFRLRVQQRASLFQASVLDARSSSSVQLHVHGDMEDDEVQSMAHHADVAMLMDERALASALSDYLVSLGKLQDQEGQDRVTDAVVALEPVMMPKVGRSKAGSRVVMPADAATGSAPSPGPSVVSRTTGSAGNRRAMQSSMASDFFASRKPG